MCDVVITHVWFVRIQQMSESISVHFVHIKHVDNELHMNFDIIARLFRQLSFNNTN